MRVDLSQRKHALLTELRDLAKERAKDGVLDQKDVAALLTRVRADDSVDEDEASVLAEIRDLYKDILTQDAARSLDGFLGNWISKQIAREQIKHDKEKARERKIDGQIEEIGQHLDELERWRIEVDARMRDMEADEKQRVLISRFFNIRHDD